jgi:thioredoxin 1
MNSPKNFAFRAMRVIVITAVLFAGIVYVHLHRQAPEVKPSPRVVVLAEGADLDALLARTPLVLVRFEAVWCSNCKALDPHLNRLADAHPEALTVVNVDVDAHPALALTSRVVAVPDTHLYVGGKPADRRIGYQTREALHEWLRPHIVAAAYSHAHDHGQHGHDRHGQDQEGDDEE